MAKICIHAFVSGRVQGVWYRNSTRNEALAASVTGWARNLPDGRVEVMLCGDESAVQDVVAWLHKGPAGARVRGVVTEKMPFEAMSGFSVL